MGLAERRKIQELKDSTLPARSREIAEICGVEIPYEVDWASIEHDAQALNFLDNLSCHRLNMALRTICIDDLYLSDPRFAAPPPEPPQVAPKVAVNQTGYLPKLPKIAVWESSATEPQKWELLADSGSVVADGLSTPFGPDANSGNSVHRIDFSSFKGQGKGFVLRVGDDKSHPFDIDKNVYKKLKYDALTYFYHNRSGIEIKMPYAGDEQWTRPAGHLPDKAPCARDIGCDYTLDVTGGWYDAGDHGKYVVNGGISVWT